MWRTDGRTDGRTIRWNGQNEYRTYRARMPKKLDDTTELILLRLRHEVKLNILTCSHNRNFNPFTVWQQIILLTSSNLRRRVIEMKDSRVMLYHLHAREPSVLLMLLELACLQAAAAVAVLLTFIVRSSASARFTAHKCRHKSLSCLLSLTITAVVISGGATPGRARSNDWLEDPPPWLRPA